MRSTYLICYDVTDDKRRDHVFKVCKNHGTHVQLSVFECDLNAMELTGLQRELLAIISCDDDQVLIVDLGPVEGRGDRVISALGRRYSKRMRHATSFDATSRSAQSPPIFDITTPKFLSAARTRER